MVYCWKCGAETKDDAGYCHKCGAALRPVEGLAGQTGFEMLGVDRSVQDHWLRRIIAFVIDVVIVSVLVIIVALVVSIPLVIGAAVTPSSPFTFPTWWGLWWLVIPFLTFGYFLFADILEGGTIGKHVMGLRVTRMDGGRVDFWSSLVRNISKVNFILLILDIVGGLAMRGEMSQKFSDRYVGTKVESNPRMRLVT